MTSCKGCFFELLLAMIMLAVGVFFVWSVETQDLEQFGTVTHRAADGTVKENPICLYGMIGATAIGIMIAAMMLRRAEKRAAWAGAIAEHSGGDPFPEVTKAARSGCGTGLAMLAILAVCGVLAFIAAMMGGL